MKKKNLAVTISLFIVAAAIMSGACSGTKTIKTDEGEITLDKKGNIMSIKAGDESVTITEKGIDIKGKEGNVVMQVGEKSKIPPNLSRDVPVYEPSVVTLTQVLGDGEKIMLGLSTKDESSKVADFYKKELADNGWKVRNTLSMGDATMLQGIKGTQKLNVTINKDDKGTAISLAFSKK